MTTETTPLHALRLDITQFMRIEALTIEADGKHVIISGKNGVGKSSAVDCLWAVLGGKTSKDLPEPIRKGAESAHGRLEIGPAPGQVEYVVERFWTAKSCRLVVTAGDGSKVSKPQALLDGLLGRFSLDPISFLARRDQDQLEDVLAIAGKAPPVAEVEALLEEPFPARDGESAYAYLTRLAGDDVGWVYDRRRDAHRVMMSKGAACHEQRSRLAALGGELKPAEKEQTATGILKEIEGLHQEQERRRDKGTEAAAARLVHRESAGRLDTLRVQRGREVAERDEITRQIQALERRKADHEKAITDLEARIAKGHPIVAEAEVEALDLERAAEAMPDKTTAIEHLLAIAGKVEHTNQGLTKRRLAGDELRRLLVEEEQATASHKTLDSCLESIRDMRGHLLDGVDLGVPGLEVGCGELRLNGVSFKQASGAQRLRTACAIAFAQAPRLRLLRIDNAEMLDQESVSILLAVAGEHGWRVIMTRVADVDGLQVEIVDGNTNGTV